MFAFGKKREDLKHPSNSITISERADEGGVLDHQGYPAFKAVSVWEGQIKKDRHNTTSNYAFADGHVKEYNFTDTVGDSTELKNKHFINEYLDSYIP